MARRRNYANSLAARRGQVAAEYVMLLTSLLTVAAIFVIPVAGGEKTFWELLIGAMSDLVTQYTIILNLPF